MDFSISQTPQTSWPKACAASALAAALLLHPVNPALASGEAEGFGLGQLIGGDEAEEEEEAASLPIVSVNHFEVTSIPAEVSVFGVIGTHYQQKLVVEVEGRIASLSPQLNPGMALKKGDEVAVIEDSSYRAALAIAEQAVAEAELSLLQEQQRSKQAGLDWQRAQVGESAPNALALREPFLKLEQIKVKAAEAALMEAKRNLANTRVVMPFDAVVMSRASTPAAYVTRGSEIAEIYSTEELNTEVNLSAQQWNLLLRENGKPVPLDQLSATVRNDAGETWNAGVVSEGAVVDTETRQQSLRLKIEPRNSSGATLKPGSFVGVSLTGTALENVLYLPASAVTLNGYIWSIAEADHENEEAPSQNAGDGAPEQSDSEDVPAQHESEAVLERHAVTPLLTQGDMVAVDASQLPAREEWQIVLNPISRYLPGQRVIVREEGE